MTADQPTPSPELLEHLAVHREAVVVVSDGTARLATEDEVEAVRFAVGVDHGATPPVVLIGRLAPLVMALAQFDRIQRTLAAEPGPTMDETLADLEAEAARRRGARAGLARMLSLASLFPAFPGAPSSTRASRASTRTSCSTLTLYFADQLVFDVTKRPVIGGRIKIKSDVTGAGGVFAAGDKFVFGLASARNATLDSVTTNAWVPLAYATPSGPPMVGTLLAHVREARTVPPAPRPRAVRSAA